MIGPDRPERLIFFHGAGSLIRARHVLLDGPVSEDDGQMIEENGALHRCHRENNAKERTPKH